MSDYESIQKIQTELKKGKSLTLLDKNELLYAQKPIGTSLYMSSIDSIEEPYKNNQIRCKICGKKYSKTNGWGHRKTNYHKMHENINIKLRNMLLGPQLIR